MQKTATGHGYLTGDIQKVPEKDSLLVKTKTAKLYFKSLFCRYRGFVFLLK